LPRINSSTFRIIASQQWENVRAQFSSSMGMVTTLVDTRSLGRSLLRMDMILLESIKEASGLVKADVE
jgi:hypothetical protein